MTPDRANVYLVFKDHSLGLEMQEALAAAGHTVVIRSDNVGQVEKACEWLKALRVNVAVFENDGDGQSVLETLNQRAAKVKTVSVGDVLAGQPQANANVLRREIGSNLGKIVKGFK